MLEIVLGVFLFAAVLGFVLCRSAAAEYDGPEEPWTEWDGEIPEFGGRTVPTQKALVQTAHFIPGGCGPDTPGAFPVARGWDEN